MSNKIIIGSRGSKLSLAYSNKVKSLILKNNPKLFGEMLQKDSYFNAIHVKYGYSITCHKSQGGEYEKVYVDFTPVTNILSEQYFRWSYTALTRGKKKLYSINAPTRYVKTDIFAERNKIRSNQTNEELDKWNRIYSGYKANNLFEGGSILLLESLLLCKNLDTLKIKAIVEWIKTLQFKNGYFPYHAKLKSEKNVSATIKILSLIKKRSLLLK